MDMKSFYKLTCGLYLVSTQHEGTKSGCVVNTVTQVTSSPAQVMVAINTENMTSGVIAKAGVFHITALTEETPMTVIGVFGYRTSSELDKFADFEQKTDANGCPYVTDGAAASFTCKLVQTVDVGTHLLLIGEVQDAEVLSEDNPMTYGYYHTVKKGYTPPKASSYQAQE